MQQLGAQDAQFLYVDSDTGFANVALVLIYAPPGPKCPRLDQDALTEHVRSRLHTSPVFRRRLQRVPLDLDYPYWVDDEHFDVDFHVATATLPKPGNWQQFRRFVSKYHNKPMNMNRPLWEICMVDGLNQIPDVPRGSFALILKAHHAALDGATGMQFFAGLSDLDAKGTPVEAAAPSPAGPAAGAVPGVGEMLRRALLNNARSPLRMLDTVRRAAPGLAPMALGMLGGAAAGADTGGKVPVTRFNQAVSPRKHFDACFLPLSDIRKIKSRVPGATINDVVLAIVGSGLRRYLQKHRELPAESLVAWVPVNARPKAGDGGAMVGNQISLMTVPLFTQVKRADERLAAIAQCTRRSKEKASGAAAQWLTEMSQHFPAYSLALTTRLILRANLARPLANLMVTNVPGAQFPLYFKGARCLHQLGLTPIGDGLALCIGAPSYNGELTLIAMSTPEVMPDIEAFVECLRSSFAELLGR